MGDEPNLVLGPTMERGRTGDAKTGGLLAKWWILGAVLAHPVTTRADSQVAYALLDEDRGHGSWPSQARLASYTGLSRRGVQKSLARLERLGFLEAEPGQGRGRTTRYCPNYAKGKTAYTAIQERLTREKAAHLSEKVRPIDQERRTTASRKANSSAVKAERGYALISPDSAIDPALRHECASSDSALHPGRSDHYPQNKDQQGKRGENIDLDADAEWLCREGKYEDYGYGAFDSAKEDLEDLLEAGGARAVVNCIEEAKRRNFFGEILRRHVTSRTEYLLRRRDG